MSDPFLENRIDIGHDHWIKYTRWSPDRDIPANAERYAGIPDIEKCGLLVGHKKPDGSECWSGVHFDTPEVRKVFGDDHVWQVVSWEPLTLSPSLLCMQCGDHGFIRDGKWVPA